MAAPQGVYSIRSKIKPEFAAGVKQRTLKAWLDGQNKNRSSMEFM